MKPKKLTFGVKLKEKDKKGPGPCEYSPNKSYTNLKYAYL